MCSNNNITIAIICSSPNLGELQKNIDTIRNELRVPTIICPKLYTRKKNLDNNFQVVLIWNPKEDFLSNWILDLIIREHFKIFRSKNLDARTYLVILNKNLPFFPAYFDITSFYLINNKKSFYHIFKTTWKKYFDELTEESTISNCSLEELFLNYVLRCSFLLTIILKTKQKSVIRTLHNELVMVQSFVQHFPQTSRLLEYVDLKRELIRNNLLVNNTHLLY